MSPNLHGQSAAVLADCLIEKGKSSAIATGYGSQSVPERLRSEPRIEQPFDPRALLNRVEQLSAGNPFEGPPR